MSSYKLTYFNVKGFGELTRFIFVQAGVEFEDIRIPRHGDEQWQLLKPTMPFGMLPVLEENGRQLAGGRVIARYLAEKPEFGLAGNNEFENAEIASIVDVIDGFTNEVLKVTAPEEDKIIQANYSKAFIEIEVPKYLGIFEKLLKKNSGFLWEGKLTWADLDLAVMIGILKIIRR